MCTGQDIFHRWVVWVYMVGFPRIVQPWTATANMTDSCRLTDMLCESSIGGVVSFPFDLFASLTLRLYRLVSVAVGRALCEYAAG